MCDVAVIGAGVIGSATAYQIAKSGAKVVLIEQFGAGHTRGSSHGASRITRHLYHTEYYTRMMIEAFPMWEQVEKESGVTFYKKTRGAYFYPKGSEELDKVVANMQSCNLPVSLLDAKQTKDSWPYLNLPDNFMAAVEEEAGILAASKAVAALQDVFIKNGGKFLDCYPVTSIVPGDVVTVKSNKGDVKAKKVVITVAQCIIYVLPLKNCRAQNKEVKISYMSCIGVEVDPDSRDANASQEGIEAMKRFISKHTTGVSTTPSIVEPCMLTTTPDDDFIIDKHPQHSNIIIGVGFTGHGFKIAPVIGKILTEMTMELPLSYDVTPFRMKRFSS